MKRLFILFVFAVIGITHSAHAQNAVLNAGYQEHSEFGVFAGGVLAGNYDFTFQMGSPDVGDDSNLVVGARLGYMFYLYRDGMTSLYAGPHIGGYLLQRSNLDASFNYVDVNETSLNYGVTAGIYFAPLNIAIDYGIDDLFESEYMAIKIGFDIFGYM